MRVVEQVIDAKVYLAEDIVKSRKEILTLFQEFGPAIKDGTAISINIDGQNITILCKNITYLGFPHPIFKKRIQIPQKWNDYIKKTNTLIIGIYSNKRETYFVVFSNFNFIDRRLNNSSAHIHTIDLIRASQDGYFCKTDMNNNFIQVFKQTNFQVFLFEFANNVNRFYSLTDQHNFYLRRAGGTLNLLEPCVSYGQLIHGKKWNGIEAYDEMLENEYENALQAEWPGWYNEFLFTKFIKSHKYEHIVCIHPPDIDLDMDLKFNDILPFLGDLKTHSNSSSGIIGNDWDSMTMALERFNRFWLVVILHDTIMDNKCGLVVRDHWNKRKKAHGIGNPIANYDSRMKNSVIVTSLKVLEINTSNWRYVSKFKQGRQQSGASRADKYVIKKSSLDNFTIYRST